MSLHALKQKQIHHINKAYAEPIVMQFENNYFHDYFRQLPFIKLKSLLDSHQIDLTGKNVLVASCGCGIDLYYLKKYFDAKYFVSDIGENAVKRVQRTFPEVKGRVEDNESMSFEDNTFDYSFVAASLHHLPRPIKGLYELLRVAKRGVIVIEPNESWLTKLATRCKFAREYEEAGNYVYRFNKQDVIKIAKALYCNYALTRCFAIHKVAKNSIEFNFLRTINSLANVCFAHVGNYIIFYIEKQQ